MSEAAQGLWRSNNYMFKLVIRPKEFFLQHDSNKLQVQERVNNIFDSCRSESISNL